MRRLGILLLFLIFPPLRAQYTPIPDPYFEQYLIDRGLDPDNTINGQVLTAAIDTVRVLDLRQADLALRSIEGIGDFTALEYLYIDNKIIDTVRLNNNLHLKGFSAWGTLMSFLDLSRNDSLISLNLRFAGLLQQSSHITLDISHLHQLDTLITGSNFFDITDLSRNTRLRFLVYSNTDYNDMAGYYNQLDTLDLSANTRLEHLELNFIPIGHLVLPPAPNLRFLELADQDFTSIDLAPYPHLQHLSMLHNTRLTSIDVTHNPELVYLNVNKCRLTGIDLTHNPILQELVLGQWWSWGSIPHDEENNHFSAPPDLYANPQLRRLFVEGIGIDALDLSGNPDLQVLFAAHNNLTGLDLQANTHLVSLLVGGNPLDSLDLRAQTQLRYLHCDSTALRILDLRNGNNRNMTGFSALGNPQLHCILVDDASWSQTHWTNVDPAGHFVETEDECAQYAVPEISRRWRLYPNPVSHTLHLIPPPGYEIQSVEISNSTGQLTGKHYGNEIVFDNLPAGVYFLRIHAHGKMFRAKVVKK